MKDLDCDWYCDECDAYMNDQPGFSAGGTWECTECGSINDVSENNIIWDDEEEDDGYVGSYQYYVDEERHQQEEWEAAYELGLIDD